VTGDVEHGFGAFLSRVFLSRVCVYPHDGTIIAEFPDAAYLVPVAATEAAKEWVKQNGSYWKNHPIPDEAKANMKKAQQLRGTDCIATFPDGHEEAFPTMLDAANATGLNVGSVKYSIDHNSTTRNGIKFRKQ
jgi:hypothetical protein